MKTIIFNTPEAVIKFAQEEVKEQIESNLSAYNVDETNELLNLISAGHQETIVIPEEPVFFNYIALDLISAGKGSVYCKACNKTYLAIQLKSIQVGFGGSPLDLQREKKNVFSRLFSKKRKPPTMYGGGGYKCPEGHSLISVIIWKTF